MSKGVVLIVWERETLMETICALNIFILRIMRFNIKQKYYIYLTSREKILNKIMNYPSENDIEISAKFHQISPKFQWKLKISVNPTKMTKFQQNLTEIWLKFYEIPVKIWWRLYVVFFSEISVNFTWTNNWSLMLNINKLS